MPRDGLPSAPLAAIDAPRARHLELDELVSPELVLVDPELAELARRSLPDVPGWRSQAPPESLTRPVSRVTARVVLAGSAGPVRAHAVRRLLPTAMWANATAAPLLLLLVVGTVVVAMVASEVRAQFLGPVTSVELTPASPLPERPGRGDATWLPTTGEVEARTIALLVAGRVAAPAALPDRRHLLANNVRVSCRQIGGIARFACRLGVGPFSSRQWRLTVLVRRGGTESLIWHGRAPGG